MMVSLTGRLISCSIAIVLTAAFIMAAKALLKQHLSSKVKYRLWFPLLFVLVLPFIPVRLAIPSLFVWMNPLHTAGEGVIANESGGAAGLNGITGEWLRDFSVSVSRQTPARFCQLVLFLWLAGVFFMALVTIYSCLRIKRIKQASLPLQDRRIRKLFDSCKRELHITQEIPILSTAYLKSPVTVGAMHPCIMIPISIITELPENELRYILMHELLHCKHKDTLINLLVCLARILYWFHPVVWIAMRELRSDGESACDGAVLEQLDRKEYLSYGNTLLKFAASLSGISYTPTAGMDVKKKDLKKRILEIRDYRCETKGEKVKGAVVLFLVTALVFSVIPSITSDAETDTFYHFPAINVEEVDLSSYFRGYEGSFVLYDTKADQYSIYNREAAIKRVSPDSTYKIYSALTALQAGVITPASTDLLWDGSVSPIEAWNQDHNLRSAMKQSVSWYFKSLDRQTGMDTIKQSLSALAYGNQDLSGKMGEFWIESTLKISPVEQVELLTRFEEGDLPFDADNMQAVKDSLFLSDSNKVSLYGKTGTGTVNQKDRNGWFIGFAQSPQNTYVFAVNIQGDDGANGSTAGQIALDILEGESICQK